MAREDDVAEIRERAHAAAKLHGPFGRVGRGHDGRHGLGGQHGLRALVLPPARAAAREIAGGARIEIEPLHSRDREVLRERVRERVAFMSTSACDVDPRKETP